MIVFLLDENYFLICRSFPFLRVLRSGFHRNRTTDRQFMCSMPPICRKIFLIRHNPFLFIVTMDDRISCLTGLPLLTEEEWVVKIVESNHGRSCVSHECCGKALKLDSDVQIKAGISPNKCLWSVGLRRQQIGIAFHIQSLKFALEYPSWWVVSFVWMLAFS